MGQRLHGMDLVRILQCQIFVRKLLVIFPVLTRLNYGFLPCHFFLHAESFLHYKNDVRCKKSDLFKEKRNVSLKCKFILRHIRDFFWGGGVAMHSICSFSC